MNNIEKSTAEAEHVDDHVFSSFAEMYPQMIEKDEQKETFFEFKDITGSTDGDNSDNDEDSPIQMLKGEGNNRSSSRPKTGVFNSMRSILGRPLSGSIDSSRSSQDLTRGSRSSQDLIRGSRSSQDLSRSTRAESGTAILSKLSSGKSKSRSGNDQMESPVSSPSVKSNRFTFSKSNKNEVPPSPV